MITSRQCSAAGLVLGIAAALACADQPTAPVSDGTDSRSAPFAPELDATKFWEAGASVGWNAITRDLNRQTLFSQNAVLRVHAYVSLAQYDAVIAAEDGKTPGTHPSVQAAVAGASAVVLTYFHPGAAQFIEAQVDAQESGAHWPGESHTDFAAGEAIGRAIGAAAIARAQTDGFDAVFTGTIPTGPCLWFSSTVPPTPPLLPLQGQMKTYFLTSGSQFRPPPPPPCGSPEFEADLDEVRQIALHRTPEQIAIAQFWAVPINSPFGGVAGFWNHQASELIVRYHQDERKAAHTLALMNLAGLDANIASHEAKYFYWFIRPTQFDPSITLAIGLPNHPSYPSNHAAISGTIAGILGHEFPAEAATLQAMAEEAGLSRIYGGIHYRFDMLAGQELARQITALALSKDVHGHEAFAIE
jgi:hypothetical protein